MKLIRYVITPHDGPHCWACALDPPFYWQHCDKRYIRGEYDTLGPRKPWPYKKLVTA